MNNIFRKYKLFLSFWWFNQFYSKRREVDIWIELLKVEKRQQTVLYYYLHNYKTFKCCTRLSCNFFSCVWINNPSNCCSTPKLQQESKLLSRETSHTRIWMQFSNEQTQLKVEVWQSNNYKCHMHFAAK